MANRDEIVEPSAQPRDTPGDEAGVESASTEALLAENQAQARRLDELARAYAEVLNDRESFRRRLERERDRQMEAAKADAAQIVLDTVDELRRASSTATDDADAMAAGVRLIADGLQRHLESMGLLPIHAEGALFDPLLHEAVDLHPTPDREADGLVIEELRGGWRVGNKVIRPARVRVARFTPSL